MLLLNYKAAPKRQPPHHDEVEEEQEQAYSPIQSKSKTMKNNNKTQNKRHDSFSSNYSDYV